MVHRQAGGHAVRRSKRPVIDTRAGQRLQKGDKVCDLPCRQPVQPDVQRSLLPDHLAPVLPNREIDWRQPRNRWQMRLRGGPVRPTLFGIQMMPDYLFKRGEGPVMAIGRRQRHIAERGRPKTVGILQQIGFAHPAGIARDRIEEARASRPEGGQTQRVKLLIGEQRPAVACAAPRGLEKKLTTPFGRRWQGGARRDPCIVGTVYTDPFRRNEGTDCVADLDDCDITGGVDVFVGRDEHLAVFRDRPDPFGQDRPAKVDPVVHRAGHFVLAHVAGHLELCGQRQERLGRQDGVQSLWQPFLRRTVKTVVELIRHLKPPIVKQNPDRFVPEVPQGRGVSRDTFADPVVPGPGGAVGPETLTALADSKAQPVTAGKCMVMTGSTGNVAVAAEDRVVKQKLTDAGLRRVRLKEIIGGNRLGPHSGRRQKEADGMEKRGGTRSVHAAILAGVVMLSNPVFAADLEEARDLMEAGEFPAAMKQFRVLARSGNADAEELIGVMFALGLGVDRDDERAFEWYLRASMKGHPGAQSGVGWYYETGRGLPAPDLVRAYLWYALSAIGGDIDAPDSLEELVPRMTRAQRDRAQVLVDDYRVWMYPFR